MEKINWIIINEKLFELERVPPEARDKGWADKWNRLVDISRKIAGCINREKYEEQQTREEGAKEEGKGADVESISRHLAEEETLL